MGLAKIYEDLNIHQSLGNTPNIDDGLSADELKEKFDEPVNVLKEAFNALIDALENTITDSEGASQIGASALKDGDISEANVQAKIESLQSQVDSVVAGGINDSSISTNQIQNNAITENKINAGAVTTDKVNDGAVTADKLANGSVITRKIADNSITSTKLDANAKKAENLTAASLSVGDTSDANIQAKLLYLQNEIKSITQGGVADGAITSGKIANNAVTADKINAGAVTEDKIASGFGLIPSGGIVMWSGILVPNGWYLCDGTNNTPDLRDRFIVGSGNIYSIGATGGEATHILTVNEMPSHAHNYNSYASNSKSLGDVGTYVEYGSKIVNTSSVGGNQAHENRPPYYALAFIMKA